MLKPLAATLLLAGPAFASSDDAWAEFAAEVESACLAAAGDTLSDALAVVDPFGSESYGLAIVSGRTANDAPASMICVLNKQSRAVEIGGELAIRVSDRGPEPLTAEDTDKAALTGELFCSFEAEARTLLFAAGNVASDQPAEAAVKLGPAGEAERRRRVRCHHPGRRVHRPRRYGGGGGDRRGDRRRRISRLSGDPDRPARRGSRDGRRGALALRPVRCRVTGGTSRPPSLLPRRRGRGGGATPPAGARKPARVSMRSAGPGRMASGARRVAALRRIVGSARSGPSSPAVPSAGRPSVAERLPCLPGCG